jgi:hypothetical protein
MEREPAIGRLRPRRLQPARPRIEPSLDNLALSDRIRVRWLNKELNFAELTPGLIAPDQSARLVPEEASILAFQVAAEERCPATPVSKQLIRAGAARALK